MTATLVLALALLFPWLFIVLFLALARLAERRNQ
jgi:hypothetical protein